MGYLAELCVFSLGILLVAGVVGKSVATLLCWWDDAFPWGFWGQDERVRRARRLRAGNKKTRPNEDRVQSLTMSSGCEGRDDVSNISIGCPRKNPSRNKRLG